MYVQLDKRTTWHRVLDVWDSHTFCGMDCGRLVSATKGTPEPWEFICPRCRDEIEKRERADHEQAAPTAG